MERRHSSGKRARRGCARLCALLFAVRMAAAFCAAPVFADYTNELIRSKQSQIESTKSERQQIQSSLANLQALKAGLEQSRSNLTAYVTQLDAELTKIQENIERLRVEILNKEAEIAQTQAELEEAIRVQEEQYAAMKKRVKFLYEKGNEYYFEVVLKAGSFAEMLNRVTYINMLSAYDAKMLQAYKDQTELVRITKETLEEEKATLDQAKAGVEAEEAAMAELIREKEAEIAQMNAQIADQEQSIANYQARIAAQDAEIAALEQAVTAEKARLKAEEEARRKRYTGGVFTWPCPEYDYISSDFGYRKAPTTGASTFHSGLDMAANSGARIVAAADGVVIAASYNASMGNYVMIDHGSGLYTIYMHCSALYCSKGQEVSAGTRIAAVGSTGISTGPHLHFSVRQNGQYVNPWSYLGK